MEEHRRQDDEVKAGFGSGWVSYKGHDVFAFIMIFGLAAALGFLIWLCITANQVAVVVNKEVLRTLNELQVHEMETTKWKAEILANQQQTIIRQDAIIYVLSLSDHERALLHLTMPNTLRQMLRHNQE